VKVDDQNSPFSIGQILDLGSASNLLLNVNVILLMLLQLAQAPEAFPLKGHTVQQVAF
jgi:hypothetical protein